MYSCVVFLLPTPNNRYKSPTYIFFSPIIYYIYGLCYSNINFQHNNWSVLTFYDRWNILIVDPMKQFKTPSEFPILRAVTFPLQFLLICVMVSFGYRTIFDFPIGSWTLPIGFLLVWVPDIYWNTDTVIDYHGYLFSWCHQRTSFKCQSIQT